MGDEIGSFHRELAIVEAAAPSIGEEVQVAGGETFGNAECVAGHPLEAGNRVAAEIDFGEQHVGGTRRELVPPAVVVVVPLAVLVLHGDQVIAVISMGRVAGETREDTLLAVHDEAPARGAILSCNTVVHRTDASGQRDRSRTRTPAVVVGVVPQEVIDVAVVVAMDHNVVGAGRHDGGNHLVVRVRVGGGHRHVG